MLADQPLDVLGVGKSRRASLGENAAQELLGVLDTGRVGGRRNHGDRKRRSAMDLGEIWWFGAMWLIKGIGGSRLAR